MQHLPVDLVGRPEPQHLPGPVVDLLEHLLHLFVGHPGEVRPLREELPYEPTRDIRDGFRNVWLLAPLPILSLDAVNLQKTAAIQSD